MAVNPRERRGAGNIGRGGLINSIRLAAVSVAVIAIATAALAQPTGPSVSSPGTGHAAEAAEDAGHPGKAVYDKTCAACHDHPAATRAPSLESLRAMRPSSVEYHMTVGYMRTQAKGLSAAQRKDLTDWLSSGQPDNSGWLQRAQCKGAAAKIDPAAKPTVSTWGLDQHNTRAETAGQSGVKKADFPKLELAWAVGLPQTPTMRSQPVVAGDTLFVVASDAGRMYAFDTKTGCAKWQYEDAAPLRSSISYGELSPGRPVIVAGDATGFVLAIDARTGKLIWRSDARLVEANRITGTPVIYKGRVYAPLSATEINHAVDESYECCKAQGAIVALDLKTGRKLWVGRTMVEATKTPEEPRRHPDVGPLGRSDLEHAGDR